MSVEQPRPQMVISPLWLQVSVPTFIAGFSVLGFLANRIYAEHPPIPKAVVTPSGRVLFTWSDIMEGQHLFQKYGLMQFGTIFGHGAYLGPDFTAQYLHHSISDATGFYRGEGESLPDARARVQEDYQRNAYDSRTRELTYTPGQVYAFARMTDFYRTWFGPPQAQSGLRRPTILDPSEVHSLTSYFSWATWTLTARRPGKDYSYTNNWPPEAVVGNVPTANAFIWSAISLIALLGGIGIVLFLFGRFNILGWHRYEIEAPDQTLRFRPPEDVKLSPSQRATAWYFLVVSGLFLAQGLLGGANAHYHVEPQGFYGFNLSNWLPYNLTRMWHLQLAIFFVAASYLAMGIFLAPMIARREPKHQDKLAIALFGAIVVVVIGSLLGEAASIKNLITVKGPWFWIGSQGWEYSGPRQAVADTAYCRDGGLGRDPGSGNTQPPSGRTPRQHALPLLIQRDLDPGVLFAGNGLWEERELRGGGLLAVLGGASVGGGLP